MIILNPDGMKELVEDLYVVLKPPKATLWGSSTSASVPLLKDYLYNKHLHAMRCQVNKRWAYVRRRCFNTNTEHFTEEILRERKHNKSLQQSPMTIFETEVFLRIYRLRPPDRRRC